jgi:hypothetical protein
VRLEHISDLHIIPGRADKIRLLSHGNQSRDECPFGTHFLVDRAEGWRANDIGNQLAPDVAVRTTAAQAANAQSKGVLARRLQTVPDNE